MLGHKVPGSRGSYMIPDTQTLLEGTKEVKGYVAVIDSLTINEENRLKKQVQELKDKDDYNRYQIDKQIKKIKEENKILSQKLVRYEEHVKYNKDCEQKIDEIIELKIEEKYLNKEYESIPVEDQKRRDSVFKNLVEIRNKRIQHENDHMKLIREHMDDKYY